VTTLHAKASLSVHDLEEANPTSSVFDPNCDAYWERRVELRDLRRQEDEGWAELRRCDRG